MSFLCSHRQYFTREEDPEHSVRLPSASNHRYPDCRFLDIRRSRYVKDQGSHSLYVRITWHPRLSRLKRSISVHCSPRTKAQNSTLWWGIEQTLTYGKSTPIFAEDTAGILDTGTSCLLLNPGTCPGCSLHPRSVQTLCYYCRCILHLSESNGRGIGQLHRFVEFYSRAIRQTPEPVL